MLLFGTCAFTFTCACISKSTCNKCYNISTVLLESCSLSCAGHLQTYMYVKYHVLYMYSTCTVHVHVLYMHVFTVHVCIFCASQTVSMSDAVIVVAHPLQTTTARLVPMSSLKFSALAVPLVVVVVVLGHPPDRCRSRSTSS